VGYIKNPILRGFNPDPSIIRVGEDYYIAVSTFEWFPGVLIYHSTDLANWNLVARPLNRVSQLNLIGVPDSGGVWAPCLSYDNGTFYLVYSNVKTFDGPWKDTPNYLITTEDITGEWSDPIFLSASGFDGSLFHEDTGQKWFTSMIVDHRKGKFFGGIILQEYSEKEKELTGEVFHLTEGTSLGKTEAPHIYQKDGFYYLILAEGGTEYGHAVTMMRSKTLTGPYETHPENPWITTSHDLTHGLQKSGHADIIETPSGEWYVVFLVGRPLTEKGRCITGRETAIEKVIWKNDWPYLESMDKKPRLEIWFDNVESIYQGQTTVYNFAIEKLSLDLQSLRIPITTDWASLTDKKGYLRLYGRESLTSLHCQSLLARRVAENNTRSIVILDYHPKSYQQMAGLIMYYNSYHWHYLHVSANDEGQRVLQLMTCDKHNITEHVKQTIILNDINDVSLRADWKGDTIQCYYQHETKDWNSVGEPLDGSILSDDYVRDEQNRYRPAFTGAFVGMCCQDLTGQKLHADFRVFIYEENVIEV